MISRITLATHCMTQVALALLFPVLDSRLVVVIFAVFTNTCHEVNKLESVQVRRIVPPLPAGSVQSVNVLTGILIFAGTRSVITVFAATLPPLFP